jgi:hypothetical protein
MFVVLSDTHGHEDARLAGRALQAVREADAVLHCGDFVTERVLDAFHDATDEFYGVFGNVDTPAVCDRLPRDRTVDLAGVAVAMRHKPSGGDTGLAMFGRERDAALVLHGHTHRPRVVETDRVVILNPGSHADPRGNPITHAELESNDSGGLDGEIRTRDGARLESFTVE